VKKLIEKYAGLRLTPLWYL